MIWENLKEIVFKRIERFVPHRIIKKKSPDPEYYNRETIRLKVKVRRAHNKAKLGELFRPDLKRLSRQLLAAKNNKKARRLLCGQYYIMKANARQRSNSM